MIVNKGSFLRLVALAVMLTGTTGQLVRAEDAVTQHGSESGNCARSTFRVLIDVGHTATSPGADSARGVHEYEKSLYERLGGVFAIAAVVEHFSDAVVKNPIVGQKSKNPQLREWHTKSLGRLPGLKFLRTLWVCSVSGGPFQYAATKPGATPLGLEEAHRDLKISPAEFAEVAAELGRTLDFVKVPDKEKVEVLAAFAAHKDEVTAGYIAAP